jgi:hypothetical protein
MRAEQRGQSSRTFRLPTLPTNDVRLVASGTACPAVPQRRPAPPSFPAAPHSLSVVHGVGSAQG